MKIHKLAIIGVGHVGSEVLTKAVASNIASEIACIDIKENVAYGEALDICHSISSTLNRNIKVYSGGFDTVKDADVIICAAGPSILPGCYERLTLAKNNVKVITDIMTEVTRYNTEAIFIMISNPLDVTTYLAATKFGWPEGRLFGTGTTLETLRFKYILSTHFNVNPQDIQGYMLGEHGNSGFPAWSTVSIGGIPLDKLDKYFPDVKLDRENIGKQVVKTAYEVLDAKGWTNTGIAAGAIRLAQAIFYDEKAVLPVSTPLHGEYGLTDVALSLPSVIGKDGVEKRLALPLEGDELENLKKSAASIQEVLRSSGVI
ncbi:MAG: L-lactate dehydrogenase [Succinivibrio sp.]